MPVYVIGRKSWFVGNTLFELLGNLKNFGIGRLVVKNSLNKFPEPSYCIIRKVLPLRELIGEGPKEHIYGKVWVEEIYRGRKLPDIQLMTTDTVMPNFRLIPKEDEHIYLNYEYKEQIKILPKYAALPPTLSKMYKNKTKKDINMEMVYHNLSEHLEYKIAEEGEIANMDLNVKILPKILEGVKEI